MKNMILFIVLSSILSPRAQEQNQTSKNLKVKQENSNIKKTIDISVGYVRNSLENNEGIVIDGKGASIKAGKIFNLGYDLIATTSLGGSLISFDNVEIPRESGRVKTYEIELSQRMALNVKAKGIVLRPFFEASISRGRFSGKASFSDQFLSGDIKQDIGYIKLGGAFGVQMILANGFAPFVKYAVSKVRFDSKGNFTSSINGQNTSKEFIFDNDQERNLNSNSLILGVGYIF